jgi:hypothetical protein
MQVATALVDQQRAVIAGLQVACGGCNSLVVCEHDVRRFEPETRDVAEEAMNALYGMMDQKPPKQLRIQVSSAWRGAEACHGPCCAASVFGQLSWGP